MEGIERRAEALLASLPEWLWDGESLPVPVEAIADSHFGLLVRDVDEMTAAPGCPEIEPGQSLSGLLLVDRGEIWVNAAEAREWPPRRRFTIGHELGHWLIHRESHRSLFCRSSRVDPEAAAGAAGAAGEPGVPGAGGEVGVPGARGASGRADRPAGGGIDIEEEASVFAAALLMPARLVRREYECDRSFERLCARFGASGTAMGRRLHAVIPGAGS
ncbi:MAG TPA: hypothetical protein VK919_12625 [Solirubrobacterales bacterium]|nr:hypothetical protein [Solirubrobacterales bacterium]